MKRSALAIIVALGLAVSGCGGDKKSESGGAAAADRATAQKLVLVASDFPAGWTGTAPSPDPEADAQDKAFAECVGGVDPAVSESATVDGHGFSKDNAEVNSEVTVVKTDEHAQTDLAGLTSGKLEGCVKDFASDAVKSELEGSGATLASLTFDPLSVDKIGDATEAFRFTATVSAGGQSLTLFLDLVFILKDRAEISLSFSEVGKPFDEALRKSLLDKMAAKVAAA